MAPYILLSNHMAAPTPIVFIHGLWLHASAWENWIERFQKEGYDPIAPPWPGDAEGVTESRQHPERIAGHGVEDITAHYRKIIKKLPAKPIVIGHSFGGLIAQKLLGEDVAAAAIALCPAQMKGVYTLPRVQLQAGLPVLKNPLNYNRAVLLTSDEFYFGFGNAITREESNALYSRFVIPAPGRPLLQAALANFIPNAPSKVNTGNEARGPLLLIAGGQDRTVPREVVLAACDHYRRSRAVTDFGEYPERGHSLPFDHGWRQVADDSLTWLRAKGL